MRARTTHSQVPQYHVQVVHSSHLGVGRTLCRCQTLITYKLCHSRAVYVLQIPERDVLPIRVRGDQNNPFVRVLDGKLRVGGTSRPVSVMACYWFCDGGRAMVHSRRRRHLLDSVCENVTRF